MKSYLIDEISEADMKRLPVFLGDNGVMSGLDKIFWINVPEEYLNEIQSGHSDCKPYFFAVELATGTVKAEFYIRSLKGMKCSCNGYSDERQSRFITHYIDDMVRKLDIKT